MRRLPAASLLCLALATTGGCAALTPAAGITVADGAAVDLLPGQSARLQDGSTLHYAALLADSRCSPDVQCVWEGDAELALEWHVPGAPMVPLRLHSSDRVGSRSAPLGERRVTLESLEPAGERARLRIARTR